MKVIALKVKGLTSRSNVKKVKPWIHLKRKLDIIFPTKVKVKGQELQDRLNQSTIILSGYIPPMSKGQEVWPWTLTQSGRIA